MNINIHDVYGICNLAVCPCMNSCQGVTETRVIKAYQKFEFVTTWDNIIVIYTYIHYIYYTEYYYTALLILVTIFLYENMKLYINVTYW